MMPRGVLVLLPLLLGSAWAVRSNYPVDGEMECQSFVEGAHHSSANSKKHVTGCKCSSSKQQVFCGYDPSPVFGRKFRVPKNKHKCEGRMYCAEAGRTTTSTTTSTLSDKDIECNLFVNGSRWVSEIISLKRPGCKCPEDERVFCRADPRPVLDNEFLIPSSKHPCESEMYCSEWALGIDEYVPKTRRDLFEPWMDSEEDQSTATDASTEATFDEQEPRSDSDDDDDDDDYRSLLSDAGRDAIREAESGETRDSDEIEDYRSPWGRTEVTKQEQDVSTKQSAKRKITPHTATEDDIFNMYYKSEAHKNELTKEDAKPTITPWTATEDDIFNMYYNNKPKGSTA